MVQHDDATAPANASLPAPTPVPLAVGDHIGQRYVIEEAISEGSFGAVYRASDREIDSHQVAIKLLHRPSASEAERAEALRELLLIASVSHPAVVQFKDYGWHQERLWFAMPWYSGRPLDRVLGLGGNTVAMSRTEAKTIFVRVAYGLAAMHAVGIHHHDIKPENIFLAEMAGFPAGFPVLLDLGIATKRGEKPKGFTADYASPETAAAMLGMQSEPIGGATDVYSLALVLRNALDPSIADQQSEASIVARLNQRASKPVPLSNKRDLHYLKPHFQRWLSLDPHERPSADQFAQALSVLSLPEERREARTKLIKKVGPFVAVALLLVAGLIVQVQRQKTVLNAQSQALDEERDMAERLRDQSVSQLAEIERQAENLGNERQQLQQAIALGRSLNQQLLGATRRATRLGAERDALAKDIQALTTERDSLAIHKQGLTTERDQLSRDKQALVTERDGLLLEKQILTSERDTLARDKQALTAEREGFVQDKQALTNERDGLRGENQALTQESERLRKQVEALQARPDPPEQPPAAAPENPASL